MTTVIGAFFIIIVIACVVGFFVGIFSEEIKWGVLAGVVTLILLTAVYSIYLRETAAGARALKSTHSNLSGGLERTVEVFDYHGKLMRKYDGKIDLKESDVPGETLFDIKEKRVVIEGGIVITEEK